MEIENIRFKIRPFYKKMRIIIFVLITLFAINTEQRPSSSSIVQCPHLCKCSTNFNNVYTASCTEIISKNSSPYSNIHALVIKPKPEFGECYIFQEIPIIFPQLNSLYMTSCSLTHIPIGHLKQLSVLLEIDISNNRLRKLNPTMFSSNQKLRYINLASNPIQIPKSRPFLISNSVWEINLSDCNISDVPVVMFNGLPNLKYLTLSNNRIKTLYSLTLPFDLKTLNLDLNEIVNVPTEELLRATHLKEINLSENPINCTCDLMGFQNWVSGKGVIFLNNIICSYPKEFVGEKLINIPPYDICESKIQFSSESDSSESCSQEHICSNVILPVSDGFQGDEPQKQDQKKISLEDSGPDAIYENDEVIPVSKKQLGKRDSAAMSDENEEGSGYGALDADTFRTDIPEPGEKIIKLTTIISSSIPTSTEIIIPSPASSLDSIESKTDSIVIDLKSSSPIIEVQSRESVENATTSDSIESRTDSTTTVELKSSTPSSTTEVQSSELLSNVTSDSIESETDSTTTVELKSSTPSSTTEVQSSELLSKVTSELIESGVNSTKSAIEEVAETEKTTVDDTSKDKVDQEAVDTEHVGATSTADTEVSEERTDSAISETTSIPPVDIPKIEEAVQTLLTTTKESVKEVEELPTKSDEVVITTIGPEKDAYTAKKSDNVSEPTTTSILLEHSTDLPIVEGIVNGTSSKNSTGALLGVDSGSKKDSMYIFGIHMNYVIASVGLAILMFICIVVVYASRSKKALRKSWTPDNRNGGKPGGNENEGTELQDVSLLSNTNRANIVKNNNNNKYPNENSSEQTEGLMNGHHDDRISKSGWENKDIPLIDDVKFDENEEIEILSNGKIDSVPPPPPSPLNPDKSGSSNDIVDGETNNNNILEKEMEIERTTVRVTMLPDSVPHKPIIINRNSFMNTSS